MSTNLGVFLTTFGSLMLMTTVSMILGKDVSAFCAAMVVVSYVYFCVGKT